MIETREQGKAVITRQADCAAENLRELSEYHAGRGRAALATHYRRLAAIQVRRALREHGYAKEVG